jgi:hypothetical protein
VRYRLLAERLLNATPPTRDAVLEMNARGVMASRFAPPFLKDDPELQKRFPPHRLRASGIGLSMAAVPTLSRRPKELYDFFSDFHNCLRNKPHRVIVQIRCLTGQLWSGTMTFLEELHKARAAVAELTVHPSELRLEGLGGVVGHDGVERITTQAVFDHLEVPQTRRTTAASIDLARLMRGLGWTQVRVRALTRRGLKEQVRGYAREVRRSRPASQPRNTATV